MGSGTSALIVIGAVVIVALLFGSQIMAFANNGAGSIQDWIQKLLHFGGMSSQNSNGTIAVGFTITFWDGSRLDINQSLLPLSISYNNKMISSIEVDVKAELLGTFGAWQSTTALDIEITEIAPATTRRDSIINNYTKTGASWTNGTVVMLASKTLSLAELESFIPPVISIWHLQVTAPVYWTATINGSPDSFVSTPATGGIDLAEHGPYLSVSSITGSVQVPLKVP